MREWHLREIGATQSVITRRKIWSLNGIINPQLEETTVFMCDTLLTLCIILIIKI